MMLCTSDRVAGFERERWLERRQNDLRTIQQLSFVEPPANLRDWFSDTTIGEWIEQELGKLDWQHPTVAGYLNEHPHQQLRPMLSILAFALLGLVFGSDEIARECRTECGFHKLTDGSAPFPHELWTVRRKYRGVLEQVMTGVLAKAICNRFGLAATILPAELHEDLREHAAERLEIARHVDTCSSW